MALVWTHAALACVTLAAWVAAMATGLAVMRDKGRVDWRNLPRTVRHHLRAGALWLAVLSLAVATGLLLPPGPSTTGLVHRAASWVMAAAAIAGVASGRRMARTGAPPPALHVAALLLATAAAAVLTVTGGMFVARLLA